jgi:hypothetical protein
MRGWWFCGATATTSRSNAEEYPNILHQGDETLKLEGIGPVIGIAAAKGAGASGPRNRHVGDWAGGMENGVTVKSTPAISSPI